MKKRYHNSRSRTPEVCPVCGEDVPPRSLACPECGADHRSGWDEAASAGDGLDLPDSDNEFDYEEFVRSEFGARSGPAAAGLRPIWWITGVVLLVILVLFYFFDAA